MEFDFSVNYRTRVSFLESFPDFADEFGLDSCFIVDKAFKNMELNQIGRASCRERV